MEFEFAKYTEITELAFKVNPTYKKEGYIRFFICPDVWDFWFIRILKDVNKDYETEDGCFLMERNKIAMDKKGERLTTKKVKQIIEDDCGDGWDNEESHDLNNLIEMLDDGFGILNLEEQPQ
jgi:hypothetical protein